MIRKAYIGDAGQQTHYRIAGRGRTLVMLHASPMSSAQMEPLISALSNEFQVIAPDTAGYGGSDRLDERELYEHDDLKPYVDWLNRFLDELRANDIIQGQVALYGTATGAQIAIETARTFAQQFSGAILDNAAHFEPDEREQILSQYFPSLAAQQDGGHLQKVWEISENLFRYFPWYEQDQAHQISTSEAPLAAVHATALCYLNAGEEYGQAYRRAFYNEDARRVQSLDIPVEVIRWQGSILKQYSDRFDQFDWPSHINMRFCEASMAARIEAISAAATKLFEI